LRSPADGGAARTSANTGKVRASSVVSAELIRVDGEHGSIHALQRRTRIGRAPGCELQVDSSSVSRHHALVMITSRDVIIEDLRSTNGVLVNGRKVARHLLNDGDLLTIGEAQFRLRVKVTMLPVVVEAAPEDSGSTAENAAAAEGASASASAAAGGGASPSPPASAGPADVDPARAASDPVEPAPDGEPS
jgi:hypothetical protein